MYFYLSFIADFIHIVLNKYVFFKTPTEKTQPASDQIRGAGVSSGQSEGRGREIIYMVYICVSWLRGQIVQQIFVHCLCLFTHSLTF